MEPAIILDVQPHMYHYDIYEHHSTWLIKQKKKKTSTVLVYLLNTGHHIKATSNSTELDIIMIKLCLLHITRTTGINT